MEFEAGELKYVHLPENEMLKRLSNYTICDGLASYPGESSHTPTSLNSMKTNDNLNVKLTVLSQKGGLGNYSPTCKCPPVYTTQKRFLPNSE